MHLNEYLPQSLSPEPLLSSGDFNISCSFDSTVGSSFSTPAIYVEGPNEGGETCSSSFLSASSVISGALEELHSEDYLSDETAWGNHNFINQAAEFLEVNQAEDFERYLLPNSRCAGGSPMSISPGNSTITSPFGSHRGSFNGNRRHNKPQTTSGNSAFSFDTIDINAIIRSSPNSLVVDSNNLQTTDNQMQFENSHITSQSSTCGGTYGHLIPKVECNNDDTAPMNITFQSLLTDDDQNVDNKINEMISTNFIPESVLNLQSPSTEQASTMSSASSALNKKTSTNNKQNSSNSKPLLKDITPQSSTELQEDAERSESPLEEEDGPKICRWVDCNVTFPNRDSMSRHIERAHIDQRKGDDFTCFWAACQRRHRPFNARYKLLIHMRVHSGEKPNKCTYKACPKAFSRLENLKIHLRSHTGERPYVCVYTNCSKAFSNSSDRAKHQRTHVDAKPYVCSVPGCKKRYTDPSSLRKHVKNHSVKEQAMAKRKLYSGNRDSLSEDSISSKNLFFTSLNKDSDLSYSNGRIFSDSMSRRCRSLQPQMSRTFTETIPRVHRTADSFHSSGQSGGFGHMGEHILSSFPSPPHTPNFDENITCFGNQQNSHPYNPVDRVPTQQQHLQHQPQIQYFQQTPCSTNSGNYTPHMNQQSSDSITALIPLQSPPPDYHHNSHYPIFHENQTNLSCSTSTTCSNRLPPFQSVLPLSKFSQLNSSTPNESNTMLLSQDQYTMQHNNFDSSYLLSPNSSYCSSNNETFSMNDSFMQNQNISPIGQGQKHL